MMLKAGITILMILLSLKFCAQVQPADVLKSALNDYRVRQNTDESPLTYLQNTSFRMPFIRRLEFRTETNEFDFSKQEYALRLTNNSFGMMKTQSKWRESMLDLLAAEHEIELQTALAERYETVAKWHFNERRKALLDTLKIILDDQKTVLEKQWASGLEADLDDFIDVEKDQRNLEDDLLETAQTAQFLQTQLFAFLNKNEALTIDENQWISLPQIQQLTAEIRADNGVLPAGARRKMIQWQLAKQDEELEIRENRNLLAFFQLRYVSDPNDLFRQRSSIGAGINLPVPRSSRLREQELHLQALDAADEQQKTTAAIRMEVQQIATEMDLLIEKRGKMGAQKMEFQRRFDVEILMNKGVADPMLLLKIRQESLAHDVRILKTEAEVFEKYIVLLAVSGRMTGLPLKNYLSGNFESLQ